MARSYGTLRTVVPGPLFRFVVPNVTCPSCGTAFDGMAVAEGDHGLVEEGDLCVCQMCGAAMKIENNRPTMITADEWQSLLPEQRAMVCRAQGLALSASGRGLRGAIGDA